MNPFSSPRNLKGALAVLAVLTLGSTAAKAQATRTWVSGVGDDVNPCSRTAPCKTWAGAISKTAASGEIDALDPGGFGAVTITKAITIDGGGGQIAGILVQGSGGVIINAGANDAVSLRNLNFNGVNSGTAAIRILQAAEVNIENCVIFEWGDASNGRGISIETGSAACRVNIKNCVIRGCPQGAVHARPGSGGAVVTITKSHLNASLFGFRAESKVGAVLEDCDLSGNTNNGAVIAPTTAAAQVSLNNCAVSDNGAFGVASVGALSIVRISNCTITGNGTGISAQSSGQLISFGNNRIKGNVTDTSGAPTSTAAQQ